MVQPPDRPPGRAPSRYRERHREARRREFLDAAREIVTTEGLAALTMQRITDRVGTSTGGIYVYFETKEILLAALQVEAIGTLGSSYRQGQDDLAAALEGAGVRRPVAALAQVIASGRFWIAAESTMPIDIELFRRLFANAPAASGRPDIDRSPLVSAALAALEPGQRRFDEAVAAKVLDDGPGLRRLLLMITGVSGALLMARMETRGLVIFDGPGLAEDLIRDLVRGWGATPKRIAEAEAAIDGAAVDLAPATP